jgi:hypothetical protein
MIFCSCCERNGPDSAGSILDKCLRLADYCQDCLYCERHCVCSSQSVVVPDAVISADPAARIKLLPFKTPVSIGISIMNT